MNKTVLISMVADFSEEPLGRYPEDSPFCGQNFRDFHLVPALKKNGMVTVVLDGTEGYGSSFLEEAFGGLIRKAGFQKDDLKNRLKLVSDDDASLVDEIWQYIDVARTA